MISTQHIKYKLNTQEYRVTFCYNKEAPDISNELSRLQSDKKILLVIDKKINKKIISNLSSDLKQSNFSIFILKVAGDKKNKNINFLFKIINTLIKKNFSKRSVVLSCGGGVVGDVCALASSLYLRGLIYMHIPTTMTAIVDSCIGGKTGINYKNIINSVGNYYHPKNVFISKNIINLIPSREYNAGIPEIIKCGYLDNKIILKYLNSDKIKINSRNFKLISQLISLTLKTKIKFFINDVYEFSKRLNLNFGHTFAHSIEMAVRSNGSDLIRHGEAVGIGMLCELYYFHGKNKLFNSLKKLLIKYKLPINLKSFIKIKKKENNENLKHQIYKNIFLDKKRINIYPRAINLQKIGKPKVCDMLDNSRIVETIEKIILN